MQPWREPTLSDICTRNLIYFDPEHEAVCRRICKVIGIDLFPDYREDWCWLLEDGTWKEKPIPKDQIAHLQTGCFDSEVLKRMEESPSNLLFVKNHYALEGVVHFTDYVKLPVYESLFRNLFQFERGLRNYLGRKGIGYGDLEAYYASIHQGEDSHEWKRLGELRRKNFRKEAKTYGNLQLAYLLELMLFSTARDNQDRLGELSFLEPVIQPIKNLRNTIMHAKDVAVWDHGVPHNFKQFQKFFRQVEDLKSAFFRLSDLLSGNKETSNKDLLTKLKKLSDKDLRSKFMQHD